MSERFERLVVVERVTGALAAIDELVAARLPHLHAPGVAIGLTDRRHTLGFVCHGLASIAAGTPVEPDTRFQIGSISKSFAAAVLLQEHEAGRVDLHAPVTDYVPWFSVRSPFAAITPHHLLSHTSGLPMGTEFSAEARYALWSLRETELTYAPGEHFLYSNDAYKLVGLIARGRDGVPVRSVRGRSHRGAACHDRHRDDDQVRLAPAGGDRLPAALRRSAGARRPAARRGAAHREPHGRRQHRLLCRRHAGLRPADPEPRRRARRPSAQRGELRALDEQGCRRPRRARHRSTATVSSRARSTASSASATRAGWSASTACS